ncbi:unnamed protein product [Protopolystoma xenopodis]|uniref:Uncharacterized protein n=1 Tax=Protopolystoma xenopodis TaxID=117903 RepID=A0A3S5CJK7_9PLAT|nr:unnamed protein product [Protopolystoma xenopodis]
MHAIPWTNSSTIRGTSSTDMSGPSPIYGQINETGEMLMGQDGKQVRRESDKRISAPSGSRRKRLMHKLRCNGSKRYYLAWLCSLGFMISFGIRCNMSWVMLAMRQITNHTIQISVHAHQASRQSMVTVGHALNASHALRHSSLVKTASHYTNEPGLINVTQVGRHPNLRIPLKA